MPDNDLITQLRTQAKEIADAGHDGWGNTMSWVADEVKRLREALRPFAAFAKTLGDMKDETLLFQTFTVAQFRAALLADTDSKGEEK